jgi:hypothetical protein
VWAESQRGALWKRRAGVPELARGQPGHLELKRKSVEWLGYLAHLIPESPALYCSALSGLMLVFLVLYKAIHSFSTFFSFFF